MKMKIRWASDRRETEKHIHGTKNMTTEQQKRSRRAQIGFAIALTLATVLIVFAAATSSNESHDFQLLRRSDETIHRRLLNSQLADPKSVELRTDAPIWSSSIDQSISSSDVKLGESAGGRPTFVFFIGIEGVGHHLVNELMVESPNMVPPRKLGMCDDPKKGGILAKLERLMFEMRGSGGLFNPQPGAKLSGYNSQTLYDQIVAILQSVDQGIADYRAKATAPFYIPINANHCGNKSMMSFPNYEGENRAFQSVNLDTYYDACRDAGVDCRHAYIYRDPYHVLSSTLKRGFNSDDLDGIRLYTMELQLIYAGMTYHAHRNIGCFGFLDLTGSKRLEDVDRFGELFGWGRTGTPESFRDFYSKMNDKELVPMTEQEKQELVPENWSLLMKSYIEIHERVIDLCYSSIHE